MRTLDLRGKKLAGTIQLPPSKSLVNRALILQACYPAIDVQTDFSADDTRVLHQALQIRQGAINLEAAGTAARFATAHFAALPGPEVTLYGTERLQQRPIAPLVDALRQLGARIQYILQEGFLPIQISGGELLGGEVRLRADQSSQFATALMLVAPKLQKGLHIFLEGEIASRAYIETTAKLMVSLGFEVNFGGNEIKISPTQNVAQQIWQPEADWSAASFWFAATALSDKADIFLTNLYQNSAQSDARLVHLFEELGVRSTFENGGLRLQKRSAQLPGMLVINLENNPDLAQNMAVFSAAAGIGAKLTGLSTLKNKETDRLQALVKELSKVGIAATANDSSLAFEAQKPRQPLEPFQTYQDHRMAMCTSLFAFLFEIQIENPEVVSKSYPDFWNHLIQIAS